MIKRDNVRVCIPRFLQIGKGSLNELPEIIKILEHIKSFLIVTDKQMVKFGYVKKLQDILGKAGLKSDVFDETVTDPTDTVVLNGVNLLKKCKNEAVIGFGGGSSMDVAKAVSYFSINKISISECYGVNKLINCRSPLIQIPTTAGTGSELTPIAIFTLESEQKMGIVDPLLYADCAILDADLTIDLPKSITAYSGIDAMVHAIEAYTSINPNNNPISKMLSIEALKLLGSSIKTAVFEGHNINARSNMLLGSMLAGKAFANSPVAAVHALAYPIGGLFNISHGLSNSLVLTNVMKFNSINEETKKNYANLAPYVFKDLDNSKSDEIVCNNFIDSLESLSKELNLPYRLRDLEIPEQACQLMASEAMKQTRLLVNNPRKIEESDAFNIYKSVW